MVTTQLVKTFNDWTNAIKKNYMLTCLFWY